MRPFRFPLLSSLLLSWVTVLSAVEQPHVLFIAVDDLNDYISPLDNHPGISTPNFERLAKRSVTFSNAHCAAPACHPSRVAVMTGVHPTTSGIYVNLFGAHGPRWRHESPVLEKAVVLSQHFRNHGYHAAGGGKIFHTLQWTPGDSQNDPEAWDEYRGDPLDPISADWPRPAFPSPNQNEGFTGKRPLNNYYFGAAALDEPEDSYGDALVVDWAAELLRRDHEKPLFLAAGLFRPHIPFEVGQKWFDLYPEDEVQLPDHLANDLDDARTPSRARWHDWVVENDQWTHLMRGYLASVSYVDHQIGRLLDALDESPLAGNVIIVLWTDHGFHIGEKKQWEKFALWEQTTRTPLFIHVPGLSKDGERCHEPVVLTDLYPTLCELAGLPIPEQCDGRSLVPRIKDPGLEQGRISLTSHIWKSGEPASHGLSDRRYRYVLYPDGTDELYDLKKDRSEFINLADDPAHSELIKKFKAAIPAKAAEPRGSPTDSSYHRGRGGAAKTDIAERPFSITLRATPGASPDGVLVAHGGEYHGYALYVKDGQLRFALRVNKQLHEIISKDPVPDRRFEVRAVLAKDGAMSLRLNGKEVESGKAPSLITTEPNEPTPSIGADDRTPVGNYDAPFGYGGRVTGFKIEITQ